MLVEPSAPIPSALTANRRPVVKFDRRKREPRWKSQKLRTRSLPKDEMSPQEPVRQCFSGDGLKVRNRGSGRFQADQARENLRRACHPMAAKPDANSSQVPGSGTVSVPPPTSQETGLFFLPPVLTGAAAAFVFPPGAQRPTGNGGADRDRKLPPTNGSYKLSGRTVSVPGIWGRFSADSKGTPGDCMAMPSPGRIGSSNFCAGGSAGDTACCCGDSSTRFPQRVRAVMLPSVITFSPLCSVTLRWVQ